MDGGTTFSVTYAELATRLGITVPSAENLCRRKQWPRSAGNDGLTRVTVPLDALDGAVPAQCRPKSPPDAGTEADPVRDTALAVLTGHIDRLNAGMMALQAERDSHAAMAHATAIEVAALKAALEATREERDRAYTLLHLREQRRWWPFRRSA